MIQGRVVPGKGSVSRRVTGERLEARRQVCGMRIVPGTLNVDAEAGALLSKLGPPTVLCELDHRLGPLQWWPLLMEFERMRGPFVAYYVRHERSRMRHVELCADVHFRTLGAVDGDQVTLAVL